MSKKVGIITQHRVVNYGSVLQTYALQEKSKIWAMNVKSLIIIQNVLLRSGC